jgi:hypothetical protein
MKNSFVKTGGLSVVLFLITLILLGFLSLVFIAGVIFGTLISGA